jgi:hypothetical protein
MNKALIILFCFFAFTVNAQNTGKIMGTVKDLNTQEWITGATVTVKGAQPYYQMTDENGRFSVTLPVGTYSLSISFVGYETLNQYNLVVGSGNDLILNFEMSEARNTLTEVVVKNDLSRSARATDMITPLSTQRLSTEEIKANPGGNFDVSRVIQALPGVAGGFTSNRNDIIVRGGAPNENVYYLDGIEIPVLNHFQTQGASGGATGMLNVSFIEDVQLSSSAFDARYDNALASTFIIKQRNGNPEKLSGNIRLSGSEFATTLEGPLSDKTTFIVSARKSYLQFLFQLLDLPIRPSYWDFQYKINHQIDKKTSLNFIGLGAIDKFRLATPKNSSPENEYIMRANPAIDQWNYTVGASLKRLINNGYYTLALSRNMFWNGADRFENNVPTEANRTLKLRSFEAENKLRMDVNKFKDGWKWSYGAMAQWVKYDVNLYNKINNGSTDSTGAVVQPPISVDFSNTIDFLKYGAFGQVSRYFFNQKLLVSGGLRTDMNTFTVSGGNPLKTLSPRISLSYALSPTVDVTASVGKYYKLPAYTVLGYQDRNQMAVNKNMNYTGSIHYTAGVQFMPKEALRFTVEGFYKDYNNYPVSLQTGLSLANQGADFTAVGNEPMASVGRGRVYGAEVFMQQKLVNKVFYVFSGTLFKSEFSGLDGVLRRSSWDYGFIAASTIGYKPGKNWEFGVKYRIAGGQPYTPFNLEASHRDYITNGVGTLDYSRVNQERLPFFNQLDFRIDKKFYYKNTTLGLFMDIQNLLLYKTPGLPNYTFKRTEDNSGFATTNGLPLAADNNNAIPLILENRSATVVPSIGFILEF